MTVLVWLFDGKCIKQERVQRINYTFHKEAIEIHGMRQDVGDDRWVADVYVEHPDAIAKIEITAL